MTKTELTKKANTQTSCCYIREILALFELVEVVLADKTDDLFPFLEVRTLDLLALEISLPI